MPLVDITNKELFFRDSVLEKYLKLVKICLDEDMYEGALIISQIKLEQIIKRIIKYKFKIEGINPKSIDVYLDNNVGTIDKLTEACFHSAYKKSCYAFVSDGLENTEEKKYFPDLWNNFKNSSKSIRNSLIHKGFYFSPAALTFATINNVYLIDLIRYSFTKSYLTVDILENFSKLKTPKRKYKFKTVEEFLGKPPKSQTTPRVNVIDFRNLKKITSAYKNYLQKKGDAT